MFTKTATTGEEDTWARGSLPEMVRVLVSAPEAEDSLKVTPKLRKALTDMIDEVLRGTEACKVTIDSAKMSMESGVIDLVGGKNQSAAIKEVHQAVLNRKEMTSWFENTKTKQKCDASTTDKFIAACALTAISAKGNTKARADFFQEVPGLIYKAGGSALQKECAAILRKHVPWGDVAKMRNKRSQKTAYMMNSERSEGDVSLLNHFIEQGASGATNPRALLFQNLLANGPSMTWDTQVINDPVVLTSVLVAMPYGKGVGIQKSVQLELLIQLLYAEVLKRCDLTQFVTAAQGVDLTLFDLFQTTSTDVSAMEHLMSLLSESAWYNQIKDTNGGSLLNHKPICALYVMCNLHLAFAHEEAQQRAMHLFMAMHVLTSRNVVPAFIAANKVREAFPWSTVRAMLADRLASVPVATVLAE